jgi:lysyl-tRNA synthetase, class II
MPDGATPADPPASPTGLTGSAAQQRLARLAKVEALRERGIDPYPVTYPRDHTLAQIREEFGSLEAGAETDTVVHVAGRVMLKRDHGGLVFMQLKDESGVLQVMASRAEVGDDGFADVHTIDIGDWMGFEGRVVVSRRGELSVLATSSLPLGAWWAKRRLHRSDGIWAIALTGGLGVFLVAGNPTEGSTPPASGCG